MRFSISALVEFFDFFLILLLNACLSHSHAGDISFLSLLLFIDSADRIWVNNLWNVAQ